MEERIQLVKKKINGREDGPIVRGYNVAGAANTEEEKENRVGNTGNIRRRESVRGSTVCSAKEGERDGVKKTTVSAEYKNINNMKEMSRGEEIKKEKKTHKK